MAQLVVGDVSLPQWVGVPSNGAGIVVGHKAICPGELTAVVRFGEQAVVVVDVVGGMSLAIGGDLFGNALTKGVVAVLSLYAGALCVGGGFCVTA